MDSGFSGSLRGFRFDDETLLPCSDHPVDVMNERIDSNPSFSPDHHQCHESSCTSRPPPLLSPDAEYPPIDDNDFSETVFEYISQMLMEEGMDERSNAFLDPSALEAQEKSLSRALRVESQSPSNNFDKPPFSFDSPDDNYSGSSSHIGGKSSTASSLSSVEPPLICNSGESRMTSLLQNPAHENFTFHSTTVSNPSLLAVDPLMNRIQVPNVFAQSHMALQFQRGLEEASKFLPKNNQVFINLESNSLNPGKEREYSCSSALGYKEKKNHEREEIEFEDERSNKQSAVYEEDAVDLSEMFDKMLIFNGRGRGEHCKNHGRHFNHEEKEKHKQNVQNNVSNGVGKAVVKKLSSSSDKATAKGAVDLRTLLVLCTQAVSSDDQRTAREYLKQIRQNSSPLGDGSQRLAHSFANGLEARLNGTGTKIYNSLASTRTTAVDMLKAYQVYLSSCPFQKMANIFANHTILDLARNTISTSTITLHIIDFGIMYGFQWPPLIFRLSRIPGGPPKLRITGIELPQRGFRPAERLHETGRHLAKCCERFSVPFEYNAIAQEWETIRVEDLKLRNGEMIAVNSMFRFKNLLDGTVALNNPRDSVLRLIRNIKPDIFLHAIVNGSYSVPFFVTRFKEALFHYTSLFDAFDENLARDDPMRLMFEKQWLGREIMNVIACEGFERVERPESYKQWQVRNMRAGFRQLPLDSFVMKKLRFKLKEGYHDDFVMDVDGHWMLQGWKGRILYASSCWVPA
ncbi:hypothetical protein SAY87_016314 [Trapa incisa]|uniref:Scarecrow-like protein 14 n=1 Tax=Trapa incisa TaxID=236973 RepID=A0AAN7L120_9MYRT|nr:hypothetical protein SAY87_016314 [Trapa incisa]